jgi:hypothetical protein
MIESARRHGPHDPRYSASALQDLEEVASRRGRSLEAERARHAERDAAGWRALQAWEEDGGTA